MENVTQFDQLSAVQREAMMMLYNGETDDLEYDVWSELLYMDLVDIDENGSDYLTSDGIALIAARHSSETVRLQQEIVRLRTALSEIERNAPNDEPQVADLANYPRAYSFWVAGKIARKALGAEEQGAQS